MILYGAGVGPGDPDLVTRRALNVLDEADVVFVPTSAQNKNSIAGNIYSRFCGDKKTYPFWFPMINDEQSRDEEILKQLRDYSALWNGAKSAAVPVIGDAALYASVSYLYKVWKTICPGLELKLIPGISAHSLASCIAGEFLAMADERMTVLSGSCEISRLTAAMAASDCVALYKPSAAGKSLPDLIGATGPWKKAVRAHRAGLPDERVVFGEDACAPTDDYLSILLLWRNRD